MGTIDYVVGGAELLDAIGPLWRGLSELPARRAAGLNRPRLTAPSSSAR